MYSMIRATVSALFVGAAGLCATVLILLVSFQEKIVYVPSPPGVSREYEYSPDKFGLGYKDVWLTSKDGVKLHAWVIYHPSQTNCPTILFFQENAGNLAHRLQSIQVLLSNLHVNVFMLSYRGYGASEGSPSQPGIKLDAQAALDHLLQRSDIGQNPIFVFGRSLGGAVATQLVKDNPDKVSGVILENTFTSILDMAGKLVPALKYVLGSRGFRPLNFLVRSQWRTIDIISKVKVPILFLSGLRDEMVPPSHMRELYTSALANPKCKFAEFEGGTHMATWYYGGIEYWREIDRFIANNSPKSDALFMK